MVLQKTKQELAATILGMTYGNLMQICGEFVNMTAPDNGARRRPKTAEDFASMLYGWADAFEDDE